MPFADKAKPLYDKGKWTQKELAELTGYSESMISRYLSGVTVPKEDVAERILEVLGAPKENPKLVEDEEVRMALNLVRDTYEGRILDLKKDLLIEKREKWIFVTMMMVVISFVFLLLYVDVTNGGVGWFRY